MKTDGLSAEKKILSTENNVRPNRDDSDHVSFITIVVDLVHQPPISKKQLGVFSQFSNILQTKGEINFKISGIG
jgi:hypothetical protein